MERQGIAAQESTIINLKKRNKMQQMQHLKKGENGKGKT
jgi:hypothetical protein